MTLKNKRGNINPFIITGIIVIGMLFMIAATVVVDRTNTQLKTQALPNCRNAEDALVIYTASGTSDVNITSRSAAENNAWYKAIADAMDWLNNRGGIFLMREQAEKELDCAKNQSHCTQNGYASCETLPLGRGSCVWDPRTSGVPVTCTADYKAKCKKVCVNNYGNTPPPISCTNSGPPKSCTPSAFGTFPQIITGSYSSDRIITRGIPESDTDFHDRVVAGAVVDASNRLNKVCWDMESDQRSTPALANPMDLCRQGNNGCSQVVDADSSMQCAPEDGSTLYEVNPHKEPVPPNNRKAGDFTVRGCGEPNLVSSEPLGETNLSNITRLSYSITCEGSCVMEQRCSLPPETPMPDPKPSEDPDSSDTPDGLRL